MANATGYIVGDRAIEIDGWKRAGKKSARVEPGEIVTDFPPEEIAGMLKDGLISEAESEGGRKKKGRR